MEWRACSRELVRQRRQTGVCSGSHARRVGVGRALCGAAAATGHLGVRARLSAAVRVAGMLGIQKQLTSVTGFDSDLVYFKGYHEDVQRDPNLFYNPATDLPRNPNTSGRPRPDFGPIALKDSTGYSDYLALASALSRRYQNNFQLGLTYTLMFYRRDTGIGNQGYGNQSLSPFDVSKDWGRSSRISTPHDQRQCPVESAGRLLARGLLSRRVRQLLHHYVAGRSVGRGRISVRRRSQHHSAEHIQAGSLAVSRRPNFPRTSGCSARSRPQRWGKCSTSTITRGTTTTPLRGTRCSGRRFPHRTRRGRANWPSELRGEMRRRHRRATGRKRRTASEPDGCRQSRPH